MFAQLTDPLVKYDASTKNSDGLHLFTDEVYPELEETVLGIRKTCLDGDHRHSSEGDKSVATTDRGHGVGNSCDHVQIPMKKFAKHATNIYHYPDYMVNDVHPDVVPTMVASAFHVMAFHDSPQGALPLCNHLAAIAIDGHKSNSGYWESITSMSFYLNYISGGSIASDVLWWTSPIGDEPSLLMRVYSNTLSVDPVENTEYPNCACS